MNKRQLALAVWCAAALCLPIVVVALQPVSPTRSANIVVRHPSLAAELPVVIEIGDAHLAPARRSPAETMGPIRMRGAHLVGLPDDPRPTVVAQKPESPAEAASAHVN